MTIYRVKNTHTQVVGLGRMKKGEIWGLHNGVANEYAPNATKKGRTFAASGDDLLTGHDFTPKGHNFSTLQVIP